MKTLQELLVELNGELAGLRKAGGRLPDAEPDPRLIHGGSRFVGPGAHPDLVKHVAEGGSIGADGDLVQFAQKGVKAPGSFAGSRRAPAGALVKALAESTGSAGGVAVSIDLASEIAELIRAQAAILKLGPTVVPVRKELDLPALSSGSAAFYTAENAAIPTSGQTFAIALALRPKALTAMVPISNRFLQDAKTDPSIEDVVKRDMAEVIALRQDLAMLQGLGSTEPLGILNTPGLTAAPSLGANGRQPTFDDLQDLVGGLREVNAKFQRPGWLLSPRILRTLAKIQVTSAGSPTGEYLGSTGLLTHDPQGATGTLLGYPFASSTQIPGSLTTGTSTDTSYIVFGSDWQEAYVGQNLALTVAMSAEASYTPDGGATWVSAFQNDQTAFRAISRHDFGLRRPNLFSVLTGVRP